jgi:hypothetical protein
LTFEKEMKNRASKNVCKRVHCQHSLLSKKFKQNKQWKIELKIFSFHREESSTLMIDTETEPT